MSGQLKQQPVTETGRSQSTTLDTGVTSLHFTEHDLRAEEDFGLPSQQRIVFDDCKRNPLKTDAQCLDELPMRIVCTFPYGLASTGQGGMDPTPCD